MKPEQVLIFDGGMGTELYEKGHFINRPFEELNRTAPNDVQAVHEAYLQAGAEILTTNTFSITRPQLAKFDISDQQESLIGAALKIANQAVDGFIRSHPGVSPPRVALSIGPLGSLLEPLGPTSFEESTAEFELVASLATKNGHYDLYVLETFSSLDELKTAVDGIRRIDTKRPIVASIAVKSSQKSVLNRFAAEFGTRPDVQFLGLNCSEGPSDLLTSLKLLTPLTTKPIIVQPNAGIPRQLNGRYFYMTSPDYIAKYAKRYIESGAAGVGGCCGTKPDHIRAIKNSVKMMNARQYPSANQTKSGQPETAVNLDTKVVSQSSLLQRLKNGQKVFSVEVNPPKGTDLETFKIHLKNLIDAGIPFVNLPDGARASTRVSSLHLAAWVNREFAGTLTAIPHLTSRDRNLIALQADLLGACVNGVHDLLLVTGDPPKLGTNRDATAVYDIDSLGLTHLVRCMNHGVSPNGDKLGVGTGFGVGVASNPTAVNLELEHQRFQWKMDAGAEYTLTQPIYEPETFLRWKDKLKGKSIPHLVGIWPLISLRNAEFMANEVPGVSVPAWVLEEMSKAGTDPVEAAKRGVEIARRVMDRLSDACEGFAVSAPLNKVPLALACIEGRL